ncbi:MAG: hypothetical protein NC350_01240 [Corallococcus sp.]|nr:hypothetical protein [Corallococcus sp.]
MKEYDRVKLTVEKEKYAKKGVHKGMAGWICDSRNIDGQWLVCFDQYGALPNIATIPVNEEDLEVVIVARVKQVGDNVVLLVDRYQYLGVDKGSKGILIAKSNNKCTIRFAKQNGVPQETEIDVNEDEFFVD